MDISEKRQVLVNHFGGENEFNKQIFDKVPPLFLMTCDNEGHVSIDTQSVAQYIESELSKGITFEDLKKRDIDVFHNVIDSLYLDTFK